MDIPTLCGALFETSPFPTALIGSAAHTFLYTNSAFLEVFERSAGDLLGKPFFEVLTHKEAGLLFLREILANGRPKLYREQRLHQDIPVFCAYAMWQVPSNAVPSGVMIQVSMSEVEEKTQAMSEALLLGAIRQQKLTEAAEDSNRLLENEILKRTQKANRLHVVQSERQDKAGQLESLVKQRTTELTETNKQLQSFVYAIAHDLRAPLRAMQGFSAILAVEAQATMSEKAKDCTLRINKASQFMDALLIDLLTFSQISQQRLQLSEIKLEAVLESVLARIRAEHHDKTIDEERVGPSPLVLAHETTLHQVLYNLASNALKFVRPNTTPLLRLRTELRPGVVRLWVEDHGIGIAPSHQSQLFQPFTRLNGERYPGTGIGLAIVQKGVERMGGSVGLESVLGEGSRFWIELKKAPDTGAVPVELKKS